MTTLDERFLSSYPILAGLGRADADGTPLGNPRMEAIAPDQWRIISEACFGYLWNRPGLTMEQRSLATMSTLVALRRDDNLHGHLLSGLDVGLSAEQIVEMMLQLIYYVGAPMANTALLLANDVFNERGIQVNPYRVYDTQETPEDLYRRGLAKRAEVLGATAGKGFDKDEAVDRDWERHLLEYLWGSIWTRPGLSTQDRCICTLSALMVVGTDDAIRTYVGAALRLGLTQDQIRELCFQQTFYIGTQNARRAKMLAEEVFSAN